MIKSKKNMLHFDFKDIRGNNNPITFSDPDEIIIARSTQEVIVCLQRVQDAVKSGFYAAGFITYEAAPAFDDSFRVNEHYTMPLLWFGLFKEPKYLTEYQKGNYTVTDWTPNVDIAEYNSSINKIKKYIEAGETYQVNYTIRLKSRFSGDDFSFYRQLTNSQSANYCAFISTEEHSILSASPELFFHLQDNKITARPMKGTIQRGKTYTEDITYFNCLSNSKKNRSENLMIVDLLRNDLGIIAEPGTVEVPTLFTIEQYPTVYQMTSTVTAQISSEVELIDIFTALFPCGSITGAPKVSTMNFISDLESSPREVYCGAIGYITPSMEAIFNVPIRTVIIEKSTGNSVYGVGGGITWDSTEQDEYEEVMTKAKFLKQKRSAFQLLESIYLNNGKYFLLQEHLERVSKSAKYFGFHISLDSILKELQIFALKNNNTEQKVRLLVSENGCVHIEGEEIKPWHVPTYICLADKPISKEETFLYHKTTNRQIYQGVKDKYPNCQDVLLWNEQNEITEFTTGNVVLEIEGCLYTPFLESGLLPGTFRKYLLDKNVIKEKKLKVNDLGICTNIWLINSVRKWTKVTPIA